MGEKWFQFVTRIKNETNSPSLKAAMKIASKRKSERNKGAEPMNKTGKAAKGKGKGTRKARGTRRRR